jgi:hypothetical protein
MLLPRGRVVARETVRIQKTFARGDVTHSNFHALTANQLHASHNVLLHLHELGELLCEIWAELAGGSVTESMAYWWVLANTNYITVKYINADLMPRCSDCDGRGMQRDSWPCKQSISKRRNRTCDQRPHD